MKRWLSQLVVLVLSIGLLSGGVHRAPDLDPARFLAGPGGLPLVLCGPGADGEADHGTACEACVIGAALVPPTAEATPSTGFITAPALVSETSAAPKACFTPFAPRGPPSLV